MTSLHIHNNTNCNLRMYHLVLDDKNNFATIIKVHAVPYSIVMSEDTTWRDQFYDGHPKKEKS